jgi:PLP dependent protein
MSVADRIKQIQETIANVCASCGRSADSVTLLAVSKTQPIQKIQEAYQAGHRTFAENYVQEALEKQEQLKSLAIDWHFIGRIQSNKSKLLAGRFNVVHSVDRLTIAEKINEAAATQKIFLQLNVANESTKAGVSRTEIDDLFRAVLALPHIQVLGLMVMPPLGLPAKEARKHFSEARQHLERLNSRLSESEKKRHPLNQLSMGTSGDYAEAIAEGSTIVRIGSDIFGPRER